MPDSPMVTAAEASRRTVLGLGTASAAAVLTGCAVYGGRPDPPPPPPPPEPDSATGDPPGTPTGTGESGGTRDTGDTGDTGGGTPVASTSDVPVGGGLIDPEHGIVLTQPASGQFRAFSATCTHQGCQVSRIEQGSIICGCHNSQFSIEDGQVVQAAQGSGLTPQTQDPLPEVGIVVEGDTISLPG